MHINISVSKLTSALRANRNKHEREFNQATETYRIRMAETLLRMHRDNEAKKDIDHHIRLLKPRSYLEDYDRAIRMAEMHTSENMTIQLDEEQFRNFIEDEWGWTNNFKSTNSTYGV